MKPLPFLVAAFWFIVLLVPETRLAALRQWQGPGGLGMWSDPAALPMGLAASDLEVAATRFPVDPVVQTARQRAKCYYANGPKGDAAFKDFVLLTHRFPGSTSMRSELLRDLFRHYLVIEPPPRAVSIPGTMPTRPGVPATPSRNSLADDTLESGISAAREGRRLEPANAFWPWMEATLEYALCRPQASLEALRLAGHCRYFDDGTRTAVLERLRILHRLRTADVADDWFEFDISYSCVLDQLRALNREFQQRSRKAVLTGHGAQGLEIVGILQRAALPLLRDQRDFEKLRFGEGVLTSSWKSGLESFGAQPPPFKDGSVDPLLSWPRRLARPFAALARSRGRADLAMEAESSLPHFRYRIFWNRFTAPGFQGMSEADRQLYDRHGMASWIMQGTVWGIGAWVLVGFLTIYPVRIRRARAACHFPYRWGWLAFCMGATAVFLFLASYRAPVDRLAFCGGTGPSSSAGVFALDHLVFLLPLVWVFPLLGVPGLRLLKAMRWRSADGGLEAVSIGQAIAAVLVGGSALVAANHATVVFTGPQDFIPLGVFGFTLQLFILLQIWRAPNSLRFSAISLGAAFYVFAMAAVWGGGDRRVYETPPVLVAGLVGLFLLGGAAWFYPEKKQGAALLLHRGWPNLAVRIRFLSGSLAVCGTATYLILVILLVPMRARAQRMLIDDLTVSDFAVFTDGYESAGDS